ncbi:MAG TPA: alpha/beta hydrolase [Flavobacteriales bacterium]|nr:alpha/beta hydrolase [Flavobacteriales bacterium]|tara:strand:- start:8668 stop:9450 length:783 start_codon:yes stop_codon:yes gene_type:complete
MKPNHLKLFSRELGAESAQNLVILHGLLGTSDNWLTLGKRFAETHRVHLIDQRNHGKSPHHIEHNYEAMADDLMHYLNERNIQSASIIGHSMGGKTALMFADRHPTRINKLIIADMAARAYTPQHAAIFDTLLSAPIAAAQSRSDVSAHLMNRLNDAGMVAFLMKNLRRNKSGGFSWRPNIPVLAKVIGVIVEEVPLNLNTLPTLAIYGGESNYVNADDLQRYKLTCMRFQSHVIEKAGHWLHASHPEEFFKQIDAFLAD